MCCTRQCCHAASSAGSLIKTFPNDPLSVRRSLVSLTLVTLVSDSQPLWRGVTQGGVAPVFPFGASPYLLPTRGPLYLPCNAAPQQDPDLSGP